MKGKKKVAPEGPMAGDCRRMLNRIPIPYGQRQLYRALYFAGERGMLYEELIRFEGVGSSDRLRGILGAFSNRINGTPGYGRDHKPGTAMVFRQEKVPGQLSGRWFMRKQMREALEALDPDWLVPV